MNVVAVLLAAGTSSRLGRPKQLVRLDGRTLVRRIAEAALASRCDRLVAVLGANAAAVERELDGLSVAAVHNEDFATGIAGSIRAGVGFIAQSTPRCDGILLLLCDQPYVDAALLRRLVACFASGGGRQIAACAYAGGVGAPAVFPRALFDELAALRGDRGAKAILERRRAEVREIVFPEAAIDIDTRGDLARVHTMGAANR